MNKRYFRLVAYAIGMSVAENNPDRSFLIEVLCAAMKKEYPRFAPEVFRKACQASNEEKPDWFPRRKG